MRTRLTFIGFVLTLLISLTGSGAAAASLRSQIDTQLPPLLTFYKYLHAHPELSHHEEHTAAYLAAELRKSGYTVTEHVGKYRDGTPAFGMVAVLRNGDGPVVLVRTELDALPVEEKTGLPFRSVVRAKNASGQDVGVMHACGHDLHMTSLLGSARMLAELKDQWRGTLMLIGQPSEETIDGARAMLGDGLYQRFPKPDYILALHDEPTIEAGKVGLRAGPVYAGATTVEVTMRGVGGHGAHPEATKDPVVMAAQFVLALQTIVSRQISPLDPAVITVGSIHGGSKSNIIPDEVVMQITTRAFSEEVRKNNIAYIGRIARGVALAAGVPEDRAPIVNVSEVENVPATYNDPKLAARLKPVLTAALGDNGVVEPKQVMVSEDFGLLGLEGRQIPVLLMLLGANSAQQIADSEKTGKPLPSLHSSGFYPQVEPALATGMLVTTSAVLDLLKKTL